VVIWELSEVKELGLRLAMKFYTLMTSIETFSLTAAGGAAISIVVSMVGILMVGKTKTAQK
jgi:hypothetical protein